MNKGSTSGVKSWQGKEARLDRASKDENILSYNRFHTISEENEEEYTRTAKHGNEVNEKNNEEITTMG